MLSSRQVIVHIIRGNNNFTVLHILRLAQQIKPDVTFNSVKLVIAEQEEMGNLMCRNGEYFHYYSSMVLD